MYIEEALYRSRIFEWFRRHFRDDRESLQENAHIGRLHSVCTSETIEKVREIVTPGRRFTI